MTICLVAQSLWFLDPMVMLGPPQSIYRQTVFYSLLSPYNNYSPLAIRIFLLNGNFFLKLRNLHHVLLLIAKGTALGVILSFKLVGWLWILSSESICPVPTIHISAPLQSSLSCQIKGYLHLWILLYITYWILHRITWNKPHTKLSL